MEEEKCNNEEKEIEQNQDDHLSFTKTDDDGIIREIYGRFIEWHDEKI